MQEIKDWFTAQLGVSHLWIGEVFIVVLLTMIAAFVASRLLKKMQKRAAATRNPWDDALTDSLYLPCKYMIWLVGFSYAAEIAGSQTETMLIQVVPLVRRIGSIFIFSWFLITFISKAEKNLMSDEYARDPLDPTTASAIGKLLRISVGITALLVALQSMGYSISGVLAFGGIGGIAVGFAAKDLLANFFGGLMVYLDRPFKVGDWIRSPDKSIEGTVEHIGWRQTCIRTFDKRPLYVPNATFTQISVENPSRMHNRRIYETIGIRYEDINKMADIVSEVKDMLVSHKEIDIDNTLIVNFDAFAPYSCDFFIYTFTKTTDWIRFHEIKQDILLQIISIIDKNGAQCAFPTSTVHVSSMPENEPPLLLAKKQLS